MFLLILYPVVALLTTLVSPLPQSNEDGNSLGSAKSANDDLPQQRGLFNRPSELSISDDDNQEAPVEDLVISSTEPIQADPASNFITSNKEESVPPNNQIADLDSDELVNLTGDQAKDEELNKGAEKSSCTDSKGNAIGESKGSTACPNPMPDSPPKLHTPPKIPDSDLGQKLPQNLPVGNPLRHLELRNFCPPGFLAFCCHGPNRKKLQQGDALEDCHDCKSLHLRSYLSHLHVLPSSNSDRDFATKTLSPPKPILIYWI